MWNSIDASIKDGINTSTVGGGGHVGDVAPKPNNGSTPNFKIRTENEHNEN